MQTSKVSIRTPEGVEAIDHGCHQEIEAIFELRTDETTMLWIHISFEGEININHPDDDSFSCEELISTRSAKEAEKAIFTHLTCNKKGL